MIHLAGSGHELRQLGLLLMHSANCNPIKSSVVLDTPVRVLRHWHRLPRLARLDRALDNLIW